MFKKSILPVLALALFSIIAITDKASAYSPVLVTKCDIYGFVISTPYESEYCESHLISPSGGRSSEICGLEKQVVDMLVLYTKQTYGAGSFQNVCKNYYKTGSKIQVTLAYEDEQGNFDKVKNVWPGKFLVTEGQEGKINTYKSNNIFSENAGLFYMFEFVIAILFLAFIVRRLKRRKIK